MSLKSFVGTIAILLILNFVISPGAYSQSRSRKVEKSMAGKKRKAPREAKIKQPKAVLKAQKKQQRKQDQLKKDYEKSVKKNRSRHYSIQTESVKERMKQNEKDIKMREKEKKKRDRQQARKPGSAKKKFKKR